MRTSNTIFARFIVRAVARLTLMIARSLPARPVLTRVALQAGAHLLVLPGRRLPWSVPIWQAPAGPTLAGAPTWQAPAGPTRAADAFQ